jgi:hypothetical protein
MRFESLKIILLFFITLGSIVNSNAQNVGIGTSTPADPLTVKSATNGMGFTQETADKTVRIGFFTTPAAGAYLQTHTDHDLQFATNNSSVQMVLQRNTGNVGIGTANPLLGGLVVNRKVGAVNAIFGSNTTGVAVETDFPGIGLNSYFSGGRKFISTGFGALISFDPNNGNLSFFNSPLVGAGGANASLSNRMVINKDGNIGIQGNTNPGAPISFSNAIGNKISLWGDPATSHYGMGIQGSLLQLYTDASSSDIAFGYGRSSVFNEVMRIKGNGRVGIGTVNPTSLLHVDGSFRLANGTEAQGRKLVSDATGTATWRSDAYGAVSAFATSQLLGDVFPFTDGVFYPAPRTEERLDVSGQFNPATAQYSVPETGYYQVFYSCPLRCLTDLPGSLCSINFSYQAEIRRNGSTLFTMPGSYRYDCASFVVSTDYPIISEIVFLTAGDVLTFGFKNRDGSANSFETNPASLRWDRPMSINVSKF